MSKLVIGLGVVFILMGAWIVLFPDQLLSAADWESRQGLYIAAGIRVVTGLVLLLSASATRYPRGLRVFGGLVLLVGLGLPFLPIHLWAEVMQFWLSEHFGVYRVVGGVVGMLMGAFLVHAALPKRAAT